MLDVFRMRALCALAGALHINTCVYICIDMHLYIYINFNIYMFFRNVCIC